MERDQPWIQNHVSILWSSAGQLYTNESWEHNGLGLELRLQFHMQPQNIWKHFGDFMMSSPSNTSQLTNQPEIRPHLQLS